MWLRIVAAVLGPWHVLSFIFFLTEGYGFSSSANLIAAMAPRMQLSFGPLCARQWSPVFVHPARAVAHASFDRAWDVTTGSLLPDKFLQGPSWPSPSLPSSLLAHNAALELTFKSRTGFRRRGVRRPELFPVLPWEISATPRAADLSPPPASAATGRAAAASLPPLSVARPSSRFRRSGAASSAPPRDASGRGGGRRNNRSFRSSRAIR